MSVDLSPDMANLSAEGFNARRFPRRAETRWESNVRGGSSRPFVSAKRTSSSSSDAPMAVEILRVVARHHPDVLVLDLRMPRADRVTVWRHIQREQARSRTVILAAVVEDELI
jgi:CheY-like chemotaxis protein